MKFLTFGEIMVRLKTPGCERLFQSPMFEATFGGGEANVAVSLANYGLDTAFITVLPENRIGDACLSELRYHNVDTSYIRRGPGRMGVYFLEAGANQLPSKVVYDRAHSAIALADPKSIDWDEVFKGIGWFHITGITPAISESAMLLALDSVRAAKAAGVKVSCDLNYRKKLWKYGRQPHEVMTELVKYVDVAVANEEDVQKSLGIKADVDVESGSLNLDKYKALSAAVLERFSNLEMITITLAREPQRGYQRLGGLPERPPGLPGQPQVHDQRHRGPRGRRGRFRRRSHLRLEHLRYPPGRPGICRSGLLPEALHLGRLQPRCCRGRGEPDERRRFRSRAALDHFSLNTVRAPPPRR